MLDLLGLLFVGFLLLLLLAGFVVSTIDCCSGNLDKRKLVRQLMEEVEKLEIDSDVIKLTLTSSKFRSIHFNNLEGYLIGRKYMLEDTDIQLEYSFTKGILLLTSTPDEVKRLLNYLLCST